MSHLDSAVAVQALSQADKLVLRACKHRAVYIQQALPYSDY
jgi:hypothetical protein